MRIHENRLLVALLGLLLLASQASCTRNGLALDGGQWGYVPLVARVTNLSEASCKGSLSGQVAAMLVKQGETSDHANSMSEDAVTALSRSPDPRPFYAFSPSYMRYGFFLQRKDSGCELHLFERQGKVLGRGKATFTNTSTYFATSPLDGCSCVTTFPLHDEG
jgi:hypothetical protein